MDSHAVCAAYTKEVMMVTQSDHDKATPENSHVGTLGHLVGWMK